MVFFFKTSDGHVVYMGRDKFENEDLIKYGIPEDIWFHVDELSSAHVYLRLDEGQKLDELPEATITECAQLVKANSIEGCKLKEVEVVYTRWKNLHKTSSMEVGAIGFHDRSKIRKMIVVKDNAIVNRISKTKEERFPNLEEEQLQRAQERRAAAKDEKRRQMFDEKIIKREREVQAKLRSYDSIMKPEKMKSVSKYGSSADDSASRAAEDDFM